MAQKLLFLCILVFAASFSSVHARENEKPISASKDTHVPMPNPEEMGMVDTTEKDFPPLRCFAGGFVVEISLRGYNTKGNEDSEKYDLRRFFAKGGGDTPFAVAIWHGEERFTYYIDYDGDGFSELVLKKGNLRLSLCETAHKSNKVRNSRRESSKTT